MSDVREDILHLIQDLQTGLRVLRGLGVRVVEHKVPAEPKPEDPSVKKPMYTAPKIGGRKTTYQFGDGRQARWVMAMQERVEKPTETPKGRQVQLFGQAARADESLAQVPSKPVWEPNPLSAEEVQAKLDELRQEIGDCTRCKLHTGRNNLVFGEGSPQARLLFAGEGPGRDEDRTGRPFVGRAGKLLSQMIEAMGTSREDVYICNIVKCRPPKNRSPLPDEVQACWDYLVRQLQVIQPDVIVTLGNPATQNLLNTRVGITRLRGQWQLLPALGDGLAGIPVMPTFHPAFLLRKYTPENRRKVWDDLQKVMAKLGLEPPKKDK